MPGQEDGKDRGEGLDCNRVHRQGEEKQCSPRHHVEEKGNGALGSHSTLLHRTLERREGRGVESLADLTNLSLPGGGASVLDGAERFHEKKKNQGRTEQKDAMRVRTPPTCVGTTESGLVKVWQWCQNRKRSGKL